MTDKLTIPRIFLDANILIAGADSRSGASRAVLLMGEIGLIQLIVSHQVLTEAERNIRKKLPRALPNFVEQMTYLQLEIVPDPDEAESKRWEHLIEAKDAPILAAAIDAQVDRLISLNTKDFNPDVGKQVGLIIQTPATFVQSIRAIINSEFDTDVD
jgi:predicted nucleic acid-binding protein